MKDNLELLHDRYARALFLSAEEDGTVDKVMETLEMLSVEWLENKEFNRFLKHPSISPAEKKNVMEKLIHRKRCCNTMLNFLKVLIGNRRETLLHAVYLRYRDLYEESKHKIRVYVVTAKTFTKGQRQSLLKTLKTKFKEDIHIEHTENPALIGGVFVKYKDRIYDYSIKSQLEGLMRGMVK